MIDVGLVGSWTSDPEDLEGIEEFGRVSLATTTPGVPGESGPVGSSMLIVVRRDGTSDAVVVEDDDAVG